MKEILFIVALLMTILAFVVALLMCEAHSTFSLDLARFEVLRKATAEVDPVAGQQIYANATKANQQLAVYKSCNQDRWCDWTVPDGWNGVEPIEIPSAKKVSENP